MSVLWGSLTIVLIDSNVMLSTLLLMTPIRSPKLTLKASESFVRTNEAKPSGCFVGPLKST